MRKTTLNALITALNSVLPNTLIKKSVRITEESLLVGDEEFSFENFPRIIIVGAGKATGQMAIALMEILDDLVLFEGTINIPYGQDLPTKLKSMTGMSSLEVNFCSHPVPDEAGVEGAKKMIAKIEASPENAIVIALISGGGSALLPLPASGLALEDLQNTNKILLSCGASIDEINCIRKHLSGIKGGQLSRYAGKRKLISLIISDVIGNDLDTIASGPTVPDSTTFQQAYAICEKYQILEQLPSAVKIHLEKGFQGTIQETPKENSTIFNNTLNYIIGSASISAEIALEYFKSQNILSTIFSDHLEGEAQEFGKRLVAMIPQFKTPRYPSAFIGTGEFTVSIHGKGKGGRNQEMLLGFLIEYAKELSTLQDYRFVIISGAFDGIEGNSPAMGAIVDSESLTNINALNLNPTDYLEKNDSYSFFQLLGDSLITGQTGTNVNDMLIVLIDKK